MRDPREDKLPVWAQNEMDNLRRTNAKEKLRADEARFASNPDTATAILYPYDEIPVGLDHPERSAARVRFRLPVNGRRIHESESYVDVWVDEHGELKLNGGCSLVLRPHVTNVVMVSLERL